MSEGRTTRKEPGGSAPPRWANALLGWYCAPELLEEIQGDLHEVFLKRVQQRGLRYARLRYGLDVLRFIGPHTLLRDQPVFDQAQGPIMLTNYIKMAARHFKKQPGYTFINVAGLAVGVACCLLIGLYVQDELSYDRFYPQADRTYRLLMEEDGEQDLTVQAALGASLERDLAEVRQMVRLFKHWERPLVARAENGFIEDHFYFADSAFFDVFPLTFQQGNPQTALEAPFSVVLTASAARKYFGDEDPMGQTLAYNTRHELTVTGVLANLPHNTHLQPDFIASMATLPQVSYAGIMDEWAVFHTYVVLAEGASSASVARSATNLMARRSTESSSPTLRLQPLADIHLHSQLANELEPNGDIRYVYLLAALGLLILAIACINYMNLATARSMMRAREVGVRKVVGARRAQLVRQFFSESLLTAFFALLLAVGLLWLVQPLLEAFTGKALRLTASAGSLVPGSLALVALIGVLAGSYPALLLSKFRPAEVLKGTRTTGRRGQWLRKNLVVVQFAASVVLIAGTFVVHQQLQYVRDATLGFAKDHVITMPVQDIEVRRSYAALREAWLQHAAVRSVGATSSAYPSRAHSDGHTVQRPDASDGNDLSILRNWTDAAYLETLEIDLAAGRGFSENLVADSQAVILNEAAVRALGWTTPHAALGQELLLNGSPVQIVGVMKDFHFNSLHHRIEPLILTPDAWPTNLLIRIQAGRITQTLAQLQATWDTFTEQPFTYSFLDDQIEALYQADRQWGRVLGTASLLAVFVACLGLFGLAAFTAEQRTKEIGIRKVLGASIPGLVGLLSKEFLVPVGIAFLLAAPVAYLAMNQWLEGFAYRIDISWQLFLFSGLIALGVAFLTVGYQAVRAALADPVKSLRYE